MHGRFIIAALLFSTGCGLLSPPLLQKDVTDPSRVFVAAGGNEEGEHTRLACVVIFDATGKKVGWAGLDTPPGESAQWVAEGLAAEIRNKLGLAARAGDHGGGIVVMVGGGFRMVPTTNPDDY